MSLVTPVARGLQIYMFTRGEHNPPHLHVKYGEHRACITIRQPHLYNGSLPARQERQVRAWIAAHHAELLEMWSNRNEPGGVYRITKEPRV